MDPDNFLGNIDFVTAEELYKRYRKDPLSVDRSWHDFFKGFDLALARYGESAVLPESLKKEFNVLRLIDDYRKRGHLFTQTNPVRSRRKYSPTLALENYGLTEKDYDTIFHAGEEIGVGPAPLRTIEEHLKQTYCRSIGAEFMYIRDQEKTRWLTQKMETSKNTPSFSVEEKKSIFDKLKLAVGMEHFIHKKFTGQKRFSLEGAETLIPAMHYLIKKGTQLGMEEFVIGMPHRGRLNILANIMQKPYEDIFREFIAKAYDGSVSLGDVKYHLGFDNVISLDGKKNVRLSLLPNPSHLEAVFPVAEGLAKALLHRKYHDDQTKVCPVILHGDAAIAGQGVVYEVVQMADLEAYTTGGTVHIVVNNQVGFTTNYLEARSSTYCTDIAKVTKAPVFHVNGDDVEALVFAVQMAMEYRQTFHSDVFIDILCYRKYGHNEGDEPRFTQPTLYKIIASHPNPMEIYAEQLIQQGIYSKEEIDAIKQSFDELLEEKFIQAQKEQHLHIRQFLKEEWRKYRYAQ
nr:thiamine pyrophosphate-dependent enzyme [Bacteroidales bacterium]